MIPCSLRVVIQGPTKTVTSKCLPFVFVPRFFLSVSVSVLCFPMDPLLCLEYLLLLLEQGERSLEGHTRLFLVLPSLTTYPDDVLYTFYDASLKIACIAPSSKDGPRVNFAAFLEWTLARNRSLFPTCFQENLASSTPYPVPSPPFTRCEECMPEPTADGETEPTATDEPLQHGAKELRISTEPELQMTLVKLREPATMPALRENAMDGVSAERSSASCATAEGELKMARGLCHSEGENAPFLEFGPGRATDPKSSPPSSPESSLSPLVPASFAPPQRSHQQQR